MNLANFLKQHRESGDIGLIVQGFQCSPYYYDSTGLDVLVKELLNIFLDRYSNTRKKILNQNTNGGLQKMNKKQNKESDKKISYCVEFKQTLNNILALLGYEFSHCLFALMGMKRLLITFIQKIDESTTYEDIKYITTIVKNIYVMKNCTICIVDDSFESKFYVVPTDTISMDQDITTNITPYFTNLLKYIHLETVNNNAITFPSFKKMIKTELINLSEHTVFNEITIDNIEQMCIQLGKFKTCYNGYFFKIWELLFRETYSDVIENKSIYPSFDESTSVIYSPFIEYLNNRYKSCDIKINKYMNMFSNYFVKVYNDTLKCFVDDDYIDVKITAQCYSHMANIAFNLFIVMTDEIAKNQNSCMFFGKSTRIQFIQLFHALQECCPRLYEYSESQLSVLHFILLQKNVLLQSVSILKDDDDIGPKKKK